MLPPFPLFCDLNVNSISEALVAILLRRGDQGGEGKTGSKEKGEEGTLLPLLHSILPAIPSVWNVFLSFSTGLIPSHTRHLSLRFSPQESLP